MKLEEWKFFNHSISDNICTLSVLKTEYFKIKLVKIIINYEAFLDYIVDIYNLFAVIERSINIFSAFDCYTTLILYIYTLRNIFQYVYDNLK